MTSEEIDNFEKIQLQLENLHKEIETLLKKSQDDAVNIFKLKFINQILTEANNLLGSKYKPFSDFDLFDVDVLPKNSDVTFIIAQYLGCMENFRVKNIYYDQRWEGQKVVRTWFWKGDDRPTSPPLNIKSK